MTKIFYDTETTGLDYRRNSIIQLAGLIEVDGIVVETFNFDIRPHPKAEIRSQALRINGKTLDEIQAYPTLEAQYAAFTKILARYVNKFDRTDKAVLIGYNNRRFDDDFLFKWFELNADHYLYSWFWANTLDVMILASQYLIHDRHKMANFKLGTVAKHLGVQVTPKDLHDGLYDAEITREIYKIVTNDNLDLL